MRKGTRKGFVVLATICVAFFVCISNLYAVMEAVPLARIANESNLIVKGRVTNLVSKEINNKKGAIFTFVELEAEDVLKGDLPNSKIVIRTKGGCASSGLCMASSNAPIFKVGEEVIVLLTQEGNVYVTTYQFLGKYTIKKDGTIEENGEDIQDFLEQIENILK